MKLLLALTIFVCIGSAANAQLTLETTPNKAQLIPKYTNNGLYYNQKFYSYGPEIKALYTQQGNEQALRYYRQFQTRNTISNITGWVGLALIGLGSGLFFNADATTGEALGTLAIGVTTTAIGYTLHLGANKKMRASVQEFNKVQVNKKTTALHIGQHKNGMGLAIHF
jgi:hypothetical protein